MKIDLRPFMDFKDLRGHPQYCASGTVFCTFRTYLDVLIGQVTNLTGELVK